MTKIAVLGAGKLGGIVAKAIFSGAVENAELCGVYSRNLEKAKILGQEVSCFATNSFEELLETKPDYIIEAAKSDAVINLTIPALEAGVSLIILTTGPFSNSIFYDKVKHIAIKNNAKVHLSSGVIGGLDIMTTAKLMGDVDATFRCQRRAREGMLSEFNGNCEELYEKSPDHLNVVATVGLACGGMQETTAILEPSTGEAPIKFSTMLEGDFGKAEIHTQLGKKGPAMAAWSAISLLNRLLSPISF